MWNSLVCSKQPKLILAAIALTAIAEPMAALGILPRMGAALRHRDDVVQTCRHPMRKLEPLIHRLEADLALPTVALEDLFVLKAVDFVGVPPRPAALMLGLLSLSLISVEALGLWAAG
jgi:hypothetical protein